MRRQEFFPLGPEMAQVREESQMRSERFEKKKICGIARSGDVGSSSDADVGRPGKFDPWRPA